MVRGAMMLAVCVLAAGCGASEAGEPSSGDGGAAGFFFGGGGFSGYGGSGGAGGSGGSGGIGNGGSGGSAAGGGSGGASGASGGDGGSGATGGSGVGGGGTCPADNTCATAEDLGTLSGDSGSPSVERTRFGAHFFKVRVTEDNHSLIGQALKIAVSLDPPNDADYDVYGYVNPTTDVSPCGTAPFDKGDAFGIGQNESFGASWGDGFTGSGNNDSRTVVVEVKHKTGACSDSATYKLTIAGNK